MTPYYIGGRPFLILVCPKKTRFFAHHVAQTPQVYKKMANFTARKIRVCSWSLPDVSPPSSACELYITAAQSPLFSISATYSSPMEVNPCKKCGRPVSVHAGLELDAKKICLLYGGKE